MSSMILQDGSPFAGEQGSQALQLTKTPGLFSVEDEQLFQGLLDQKRKKYLERNDALNSLGRTLVGQNATITFANNCEQALSDWATLLRNTKLPAGIACTDHRVIAAFRFVDAVICGQGSSVLQRLANVQLMRLFGAVEAMIKRDRQEKLIHRESGYRNSQMAMDIYMSAQEMGSNASRQKIQQGRKRLSQRWSVLATPTPLFVLIYADAAEPIIKDFRTTDKTTLDLVAAKIVKSCPPKLLNTCLLLAEVAEAAAQTSEPVDLSQFSAAKIQSYIELAAP